MITSIKKLFLISFNFNGSLPACLNINNNYFRLQLMDDFQRLSLQVFQHPLLSKKYFLLLFPIIVFTVLRFLLFYNKSFFIVKAYYYKSSVASSTTPFWSDFISQNDPNHNLQTSALRFPAVIKVRSLILI
jgi:hypothetical protein